jgi:regulator of nucleoside diphosphate kinase
MAHRQIVVTQQDARRLRSLLVSRARVERDEEHVEELAYELEQALVLASEEVPAQVVTMQSRVRVLDLVTGERREFALVFPAEADPAANRVSVLAPLGTALLGYREGDQVEWVMPGGPRRLLIEGVTQVNAVAAEANAADAGRPSSPEFQTALAAH